MKKITGFILMGLTMMFVLMLFAGPAAAVLIVDGDFEANGDYIPGVPHENGDPNQVSSLNLRANGTGQDWYESRAFDDHPLKLMLYSNTFDGVFGNYTNMARLRGDQVGSGTGGSAYLTQDFDAAQNGMFSLSFDIAIDTIYNISSASDATGLVYVGNDDGGTRGPNSPNGERFVYLGFYDNGGGTTGQSLELRARTSSGTFNVFGSTNLSYDTWYTVTLDIDVAGNTYDVTVDDHSSGILTANGISAFSDIDNLTSLSFMVGGTGDDFGKGIFFVDNVSEVPIPGGIWLFCSGLMGIVGIRKKFNK